jgi:hypothetical protein
MTNSLGNFDRANKLSLAIAPMLILTFWSSIARAQCNAKPEVLEVSASRSSIERLQKDVIKGHQPWLLDDRSVADDEIDRLDEKYKGGSYVVFLSVMSQEDQTAKFEYELSNKTKRYIVTVQRPGWLLPISKKLEWTIWILKDIQVTDCVAQGKSTK